MNDDQYYFSQLLIPYLQKELKGKGVSSPPKEVAELVQCAHSLSVKTHFLKRLDNPRLLWAVSKLKGLWPESLLDIGAGNGYLSWYMLENIPGIKLVAADMNLYKARRISKVAASAGINLRTICCNGEALPFGDNSFQSVSLLEVLEHTRNPGKLISEAVRVCHGWIIASVPSKEDNNPEHIHLFTRDRLKRLFQNAGVNLRDKDFNNGVPNHLCWLVRMNKEDLNSG